MLWPKKNSCKEFDNEKKFLRLENSPPPPHNFSNGPSLNKCNLVIVIWFHLEMLQFGKNYFDCSVMSPEKAAFTNAVRLYQGGSWYRPSQNNSVIS